MRTGNEVEVEVPAVAGGEPKLGQERGAEVEVRQQNLVKRVSPFSTIAFRYNNYTTFIFNLVPWNRHFSFPFPQ